MAIRPIDGNELYRIEKLLDTDIVRQDKVALNLLEQVLYDIQHVPTLTPPNEPLTLNQLRKMDGQPVWCEDVEHWALVSVSDAGKWKGVPFALFEKNGARFEWNIEDHGLCMHPYPPAQQRWIPVSERLPEYNPGAGQNAYWIAKKNRRGEWEMKIALYCDYGYAMSVDVPSEVTWRDYDYCKITNVTHWMPLPKPPEEG